jgi:hypothetical protein
LNGTLGARTPTANLNAGVFVAKMHATDIQPKSDECLLAFTAN